MAAILDFQACILKIVELKNRSFKINKILYAYTMKGNNGDYGSIFAITSKQNYLYFYLFFAQNSSAILFFRPDYFFI